LKNLKALPYILLLGFLFGSNLVASRFCLAQFSSITFNALRLLLATLQFSLVYAFSFKRGIPLDGGLWLKGSFFGIVGVAIPMTMFITSMQYQSSGVTSLLITLNPVVTAVFAHFLLKNETFDLRKIAGTLLALGGAAAVLGSGENGLSGFGKADWRGYALVLGGVVLYALGAIFARRYLTSYNLFDVAAVRMASGAAFLLPVAAMVSDFDLKMVTPTGWGGLAYSAVAGTFVAFLVEFLIIKRFGATNATQSSYFTPLVAGTLGSLVLGEVVRPVLLLAALAIFGGLTLLNRSPAVLMKELKQETQVKL